MKRKTKTPGKANRRKLRSTWDAGASFQLRLSTLKHSDTTLISAQDTAFLLKQRAASRLPVT